MERSIDGEENINHRLQSKHNRPMLSVHWRVYDVRGCTATTSAPFNTPSPFFSIHRPIRGSCPTPATSSTDFALCAFLGLGASDSITSSEDWLVQLYASRVLRGQGRSWRELTTPGAGIFPTSANDLSLASSFQRRIEPSHEPRLVLDGNDCEGRYTYRTQTGLSSGGSLVR